MITYKIDIEGMRCAGCQGRLEKQLKASDQIVSASVNLANDQAHIVMKKANLDHVLSLITKAGFKGSIQEDGVDARPEKSHSDFVLFLFSSLLTLPLIAPMVGLPFGYDWHLGAIAQFILATPVQVIAIWRFYPPAWIALRHKSATMDTLVALGTTAAYTLSLYQYYTDQQTAMLYFEASARLQPQTVTRLEDGEKKSCALKDVKIGDILFVSSGQIIPTDSVVLAGMSDVDESLLTGESLPITKVTGDSVTGGAVNGTGALTLRVTAVGAATMVSQIISLIEETQAQKAPIQKKVDQISAVFVPCVLAIAALTYLGWFIAGASAQIALLNMISVLVIACPCALGLATPTALIAGIGTAARHGVLIKNAECLEKGTQINHLVFDKTGTLTKGDMVLHDHTGSAESLKITQSLQAQSLHPLARAFETEAPLYGVDDFKTQLGQWIEGTINGKWSFVSQGNMPISEQENQWQAQGYSVVWLRCEGEVLASYAIGDEILPQSKSLIQKLMQKGVAVSLLSGDAQKTVEYIGRSLGLATVMAEQTPVDKVAYVQTLQSHEGASVAMVGDGMNDAAALSSADLGIAMGQGSDIALNNADMILMRQDPTLVLYGLDIARATYGKIKQNLFWAFLYNTLMIPAAVFGLLNPVLAGAAMAFSSVSVVVNALMLKRWKP